MASEKPEGDEGAPRPSSGRLSEDEKLDWLRLIRSENIGPVTFHRLIEHFGTPAAALDALPRLRRQGGSREPARVCSRQDAERELRIAERAGMQAVALPEAAYPSLLRHIESPPPLIYLRGDPSLAARPAVAIVGSRSASAAGRQFAHSLARDLGREGITVVSGLARGIDTAAHHGALETGTIAVVAGGIDIIYPPENDRLHAAIAERGLILSESPPGFLPRGQDFPRRNRLISGISVGVTVVEAAQRSGSLITARMALEQNREVFAVPGHPLDPRAAGTNELIKSGACLITSAADILQAIPPSYLACQSFREVHQAAAPDALADAPDLQPRERMLVAEALGLAPVNTDILVRMTGLSARQVAIALIELDLAGRLEHHGQHSVSLRTEAAAFA